MDHGKQKTALLDMMTEVASIYTHYGTLMSMIEELNTIRLTLHFGILIVFFRPLCTFLEMFNFLTCLFHQI